MYTLGSYSIFFIGVWLVWWLVWIALWRWSKTTEKAEINGREITYRVLLALAFVVTLSDLQVVPILNIKLYFSSSLTIVLGAIVMLVGLALTFYARVILAKNWSHKTELKKEHSLIEKGPYKIIRNPIYTGLLLMFLGTALATGLLVTTLGVIFALSSFLIRIKLEEKLLTSHFGEIYLEYKKKTWALIPFIY